MRGLIPTIVEANIRYFIKQGWEQPETLDRLNRWFSGSEDEELGKKVVSWLLSDAQWTEEILPSMVRRFWFISPVIIFVAWYMRRLASREASRIYSLNYHYR